MVFGILRFRKTPDSPISEFYILTHPFYHGYNNDYEDLDYFDLWKQSISKASEREGVFAILYFSKDLWDDDRIPLILKRLKSELLLKHAFKERPYLWEHHRNHLIRQGLDNELLRYAFKRFGKNRILFHRLGGTEGGSIFSKEVRMRLKDRKRTKVTGRGIYGFQCVESVAEVTCSVYNIPYENGSVDWLESVDSIGISTGRSDIYGGYHPKERFPDIRKRREMEAKFSEQEYKEWIAEKLERFRVVVGSDAREWAYNLNPTRIKTYWGDQDFLSRKFGDLRLQNLKDDDFSNKEKARRVAIAYQFLVNPFSLYGIDRQLSTKRFRVNPPFPDIDNPDPWEVGRAEILAFSNRLGEFLLGRQVKTDDINTLGSIVNRAAEKDLVVMSIYPDPLNPYSKKY